MNAIKSFVDKELIGRPWFLLGIAAVAVGYFMINSAVDWLGYLQQAMT
jgi:hypothetical protein